MPEDSLITKGPEVADVNRSIWKTWATVIVPAIVVFGASYLFINGNLLWGGILAVIFLSFLALQTFFLKEFGYTALALFLGTVGLIAPYYHVSFNYLAISAALIFVCFLAGVHAGRKELENALKVPFSRVARKALIGGATGVLLGVTILGFVSSESGSFSSANSMTKVLVDPFITPVVRIFSPEYSASMPTKDLLISLTERYVLPGQVPGFDKLPPVMQAKLADQVIGQMTGGLKAYINIDAPVAVNLVEFVTKGIGSLQLPFQIQIAIYAFIFILVWFTLRFIAAILSYPLLITTFIFFEISVASGFAVIQLESRSREIVLLS